MKNKSIKYILLSVALASSLLFIACSRKSEPVNDTPETTQTEQDNTSEELTVETTDEVEGHEVEIKDNSTTESTSSVDSTGVDVQLSEDEYQGTRPEDDGQVSKTESTETTGQRSTEDVLADLKDYYESGIFTKEQYDALVQAAQGQSSSTSSSDGGYAQQPLTPEQQAAVDAMRTDNKGDVGDNRTDIQYGQAEVPDDLKGKFIGN
ncbi:MAG: hypothetical protein IKY94_04710 [Lachnospiraceae bacterium]|nr:hypothetical protein [Lachnospiraceae bacterium]